MDTGAIRTFPRETTQKISSEFYKYFNRKAEQKLTYREAQTLIDHEAGPSPSVSGVSGIDYSKPRVSGGGRVRPSDIDVDCIYRKREENEPDPWDEVFSEAMRKFERSPEIEKLVLMTYRDRHSDMVICDEMGIGRTTYYDWKRVALDRIGGIAVQKGVLNHCNC